MAARGTGADHHIFAPRPRGDFELCDFPVAQFALDGGVLGRAELEMDVPVLLPGGKNENAVVRRLQEHFLQADHGAAAMIHVGEGVKGIGDPEGREARGEGGAVAGVRGLVRHARGIEELGETVSLRFVRQPESRDLDAAVFPAQRFLLAPVVEGAESPRVAGQFQVRQAGAIDAERERGIELGKLVRIGNGLPGFGQRDNPVSVRSGRRDRGNPLRQGLQPNAARN